jgi:hypothetical protein
MCFRADILLQVLYKNDGSLTLYELCIAEGNSSGPCTFHRENVCRVQGHASYNSPFGA